MTHAQNSNYASPDHKPFKDKKKYERARNINLIALFCVNYLQNIYIWTPGKPFNLKDKFCGTPWHFIFQKPLRIRMRTQP